MRGSNAWTRLGSLRRFRAQNRAWWETALAVSVPTAMLFVRNPTGTSHSPAERAEADDCVAGVEALAAVVEELACR